MWVKFGLVLKQFSLNILILHLSQIYWTKGNNCYFIDCLKKSTLITACIQTFYKWNLVQIWYDDRWSCIQHFHRSQGMRNQKFLHQFSPKVFILFGWNSYGVETCSTHQYWMHRTTNVILSHQNLELVWIWTFKDDLYDWYDHRDYWTLHFDHFGWP